MESSGVGREVGRRGPCGREEGKRGPRERERELGCWALFPSLLLFFFFSTLKLFKQFHLNSNEFEFKLYKLNTRKNNAPA
jgi:hypothetical protein